MLRFTLKTLVLCAAIAATPAIAAADTATPDSGIWQRPALTGNWDGIRDRLADQGFTIGASETAETLGNVSGGLRSGAIFEGKFAVSLTADLSKIVGWQGGTFYADAYQIHGRGLTANDIDNYFTVSSIEAGRSTRLHDLYLDQSFLGDAASFRVGEIAADDEFLISQYAGTFVNAMFGWPGLASNDVPAAVYPLATPGARLKLTEGNWTGMVAAFNGNPVTADTSGTNLSLTRDIFGIAELDYHHQPAEGLSGTYKFGAWYHSGSFADQRDGGTSSNLNNYSLYGVVDQMLWQRPGTQGQGVAGFVRVMGAPDDRNVIALGVDGGLNLIGTLPGRESDIAGLAFSYGAISSDRQDFLRATGPPQAVPDDETVFEATYQLSVAPWWTIQPDLQYVAHPGGHGSNSVTATPNATILGLRTAVNF